ncbi:uncharacterized protein zgc:112980 isoform X2 [Nothobranchius furzeri]|uniref:Transcript variant X2 n=1 Tax=Nothobranchius furzeri TaxID=105023 RepID=A0A9D3BZ35_NOTFU|nr:uncharacterized protein zgc:112980 isoform X2 [Nothobranchius furzeri]KAF7223553.1 transcript variant X2 [Nothobranchius furzeri]
MMNSDEVIILSDDDDYDEDKEKDCIVVDVNNEKKPESVSSLSIQDEDLVVTFSRQADVLPHARYDCPVVPFTLTYSETEAPVAGNKLFCEQCYCYICDKLASLCVVWCQSGLCHCNSHKRSDFWNNTRNVVLLGELNKFNFTLSEVDSHLRDAGTMLQKFRTDLYALFSHIIMDRTGHQQYQPTSGHDEKKLLEFVSRFLEQADGLNSRATVVLYLGVAKAFNRLFYLLGPTRQLPTYEGVKEELLQKVMKTVQRHIVMGDFTPQFIHKLQDFYQKKVFLPCEMKYLKNSPCIRLWNDVLLVSVLKGQNVLGYRMDKGKKDVLFEPISVVQLRSERLQHQHRYRELCRYLRVVQSNDSTLFQQLRDLVPFFFCLLGNFSSAIMNLFPPANAPASRFSPQLFLVFLRIFQTATAPKLMVTHMEQLCSSSATWEPIEAEPMKCVDLVKFALRAQRFSTSVLSDSQCWTSLLQIVNSPALPAPSPQFLHDAQDVVKSLLCEKVSNMPIPRTFLEVYPDQALLLLVTGALGAQILDASLSPALPVLSTFKGNLWALQWLFESLAESKERFESIRQQITLEAANTTESSLAAGWIQSSQQQSPPEAT